MAFDPNKYQQFKSTIPVVKTPTVIDTAKEKGVGLLKSTIDIVNTFAYGIGGALSGVSPLEGIKRKILPSQALGITNAISAFATDVLLDPTTYITLGAGGGAKIATKTGAEVTLNKLGTTALRETIERVGAKKGKTLFSKLIAKNPQWLDKSGIKFMGQTLIPQTAVESSVKILSKPIIKIAKKIPGVEKIATATKNFATEIFNPLKKIEDLPMGKDFLKKFSLVTKSTRSEIVDATELIAKEYAQNVAKFGKTFGDDVTEYMEKGITKSPEVAKAGQNIIKLQDIMATAEEARGLLKSTLGQTIGKVSPKIKPIVEKYSDDILNGVIKTSDEFKSVLSKSEKALLKGNNTPTKLYEKIITSKPNVDNYVRHYITDAGREYIQKGGDFYGSLPKPLRAKLQSGNMRTIRSSISDVNKAMAGKINGNFFETNAFKALAGRQAESIKAINIFDFIDGVKKDYGLQAIKGEKERFIDGIKYIPSTNPQLDGVLLPDAIVKHIDDTIKFINGDEATNNFLKGYDKLLRFWKGSVTGYFPAFHTRNLIGGSFNNWLAKVSSKSYAISEDILDLSKDLTKTYKSKIGEVFTGKQLLDGARKHGAIGQPGMIDAMMEVEKDIGKSKLAKLGDYPIKTMEFVENRLRFPLFVDRVINRGWSMEDAAKDVFKYHFDYAPEGLSSFERNWLKRLFPFYTWTRNNIPLQIEQMIKQPGKYASLGKLQDTIGGEKGKEEFKDLPEWMKQQLSFRIGGENGMSTWLQLPLPVEDIAKLPVNEEGIRDIVSMLSPVIKTPIELVTNKNLFFGSDIVNPELKDYPELQTTKTINGLKLLPQPIKDFINFKIIKKKVYEGGKAIWKEQAEMDAKKLYIFKSAFGRFYSTIEQVGGDKEDIAQKISRLLGGVPVREVDIEQQKYWDTYNKETGEKAKKAYEKSRIPIE